MRFDVSWKVVSISTITFITLFSALSAIRMWDLEPSTSIQTAIVVSTAVLTTVLVTYYISTGGNLIQGWILALGPSLAYTLNLLIPVLRVEPLFLIIYPLIPAIVIAGIIGFIGYSITSIMEIKL